MRICTKFSSESSDIPSDVPSYPTFSPLKFMAKLVAARIAMLIRRQSLSPIGGPYNDDIRGGMSQLGQTEKNSV
jgi:hypothetical protein